MATFTAVRVTPAVKYDARPRPLSKGILTCRILCPPIVLSQEIVRCYPQGHHMAPRPIVVAVVLVLVAVAGGAGSLTVAVAPAERAGLPPSPIELRLAGGVFRPLVAEAAVQPALAWFRAIPEESSPRGRRYLVAITRASLDAEERRLLEAAGADLLD